MRLQPGMVGAVSIACGLAGLVEQIAGVRGRRALATKGQPAQGQPAEGQTT